MIVIKKDGRHEPFLSGKIARSAIASARDQGLHISDKEGELLSEDVHKMIESLRGKNGLTSSYELRMVLSLVLKRFGYTKVAQSYLCDILE
ncbi:MAG: hypothetical protein GX978_07340 [Tissierellia bacterium]|jgi:transcriptional regulator NrdR family protein|nr:hypothetical protein [Tissierellia bacterium]